MTPDRKAAHRAAQPEHVRRFREAMWAAARLHKMHTHPFMTPYQHHAAIVARRDNARRLAWRSPTCRRMLAGLLGHAPRCYGCRETGEVLCCACETDPRPAQRAAHRRYRWRKRKKAGLKWWDNSRDAELFPRS